MTNPTAPLKIGVIGCGHMGAVNAQAAIKSGVARIIAASDPSVSATRALAKRYKAESFSSADELLSNADIDTVMINAPHDLHLELGRKAAEAGKHLFMEKPLCIDLDQATELIQLCEANQVKLTSNYWYRYAPSVQRAREIVQSGALGSVVGLQVEAHQHKPPSYWLGGGLFPSNWRSRRERCGGGMLIMTTCHAVDFACFVSGLEVTEVCSDFATLATAANVDDIQSVLIRCKNGAFGSIFTSSCLRGSRIERQVFWGTLGTLELSGDKISLYSTRWVDRYRPGSWHTIKCPKADPVAGVARVFTQLHAAIRRNENLEITPEIAWSNLSVISASYLSKTEKRFIQVPAWQDVRQSAPAVRAAC